MCIATPANAEGTDSLIVVTLDEVNIISSPKEDGLMRQQPTSVSIINSQTMAERRVTSLKNLSALVPNFFIPEYGSRLTSAVYIRGIGSRINTPAVALYVDNIPYIDKSAYDFNFYDIDRVDVLRGPQATLYGRNSMGGLVKVYTKSPFTGEGTDVKFGFSTRDNRYNASVTHFHRISDDFAFAAGGYYEGARGMFTNSTSGKRVDDMKAGGGRIRAIWLPNSSLKFDLNLSYDNSDEGAYPYFYEGVVEGDEEYPDLVGLISNNREHRYRRSLTNVGLNTEYLAEDWQMNAVTGFQSLGDRMTLDQDFLRPDIYTMEQNQRINTLTQEVTFRSRSRVGEKPLWQWVSGANFMYQWLHTEAPVTFHSDGLRWLERNVNSMMPDASSITMLNAMGFTSMGIGFRGDDLRMGNTFDTPTLGLAAFHQSTFNITQRLSLAVGLRLDYEHTSMDYYAPADVDYSFAMPNASNPRMAVDLSSLESHLLYDGQLSADYLRLLPKFSLAYDLPSRRGNIYLTVSEGMRSGGYNLQMFSDLLQGAMRVDMMDGVKGGVNDYLARLAETVPTMPAFVPGLVAGIMDEQMPQFQTPTTDQVVYRPEYSWNYEVGTHLNLLDHTLMVDAAAFVVQTRNQQIARFADTGLGRKMVNAGRSRSLGAELSLRWTPDSHLALSANYGYTHSTFTRYDGGRPGEDYSGNYIPFVPLHAAGIDAAYTFLVQRSSWLDALSVGTDFSATGPIYWTEDNAHRQNLYAQLGVRVMLHTPCATVTLWGKNLTHTHYDTFYFQTANHALSQHGRPLQLGVDVKVNIK